MNLTYYLKMVLLPASFLLLISCSQTPMFFEESSIEIENKQWQLINTEQTLLLNSETMRATGYGGCNRFFAGYTLEGNQLSIGLIGSTKRLCMENSEESDYFKKLGQVNTFSLEGSTLNLFGEQGLLLQLTPVSQ